MELLVLGADKMIKAIERYKHEIEQDKEWRKPQNGSTFFSTCYIDYLDKNYVPSKKTQKQGNAFNKFEQRDYDYTELDINLLMNTPIETMVRAKDNADDVNEITGVEFIGDTPYYKMSNGILVCACRDDLVEKI